MMPSMHVLIATGGTGGHVYPALAVAEELMHRGVRVSWMGTRKGMEEKLVSARSIPLHFVSVSGLRGKGLSGWLLAPFKLTYAIAQAINILMTQKPNVVLGMGGFVSGPGGIASWLLQKPLVIHEQNTVAGMTNKMLSHFATQVVEAFPDTFDKKVKAVYAGNPVRSDIEDINAPAERYEQASNKAVKVLVIGGSLGATALNENLPYVFHAIKEKCNFEIVHQTGLRHLESAKQSYQQYAVQAEVLDYIDDMSTMYRWADLVICRAGALTVSEIAIVGLAAVFIPFPYAVDDHQYFNAKYLADNDAAIVTRQANIQSTEFISMLEKLMCNGREKLQAMAENARTLAMPGAASKVADICCNLFNPKHGTVNG